MQKLSDLKIQQKEIQKQIDDLTNRSRRAIVIEEQLVVKLSSMVGRGDRDELLNHLIVNTPIPSPKKMTSTTVSLSKEVWAKLKEVKKSGYTISSFLDLCLVECMNYKKQERGS